MAANFDFRFIRDVVAFPIRFVFGAGTDDRELRALSQRRPLVLRWRLGDDGKLDSHWECED